MNASSHWSTDVLDDRSVTVREPLRFAPPTLIRLIFQFCESLAVLGDCSGGRQTLGDPTRPRRPGSTRARA